jgi:hypothetical protein
MDTGQGRQVDMDRIGHETTEKIDSINVSRETLRASPIRSARVHDPTSPLPHNGAQQKRKTHDEKNKYTPNTGKGRT